VDSLEAAGLSSENVLELLHEPNGQRREELCATLQTPRQRSLVSALTTDLPSVNRTMLHETVRWARRQWTSPLTKVRGERPRRGGIS